MYKLFSENKTRKFFTQIATVERGKMSKTMKTGKNVWPRSVIKPSRAKLQVCILPPENSREIFFLLLFLFYLCPQ
jgi:hypothetical protein